MLREPNCIVGSHPANPTKTSDDRSREPTKTTAASPCCLEQGGGRFTIQQIWSAAASTIRRTIASSASAGRRIRAATK